MKMTKLEKAAILKAKKNPVLSPSETARAHLEREPIVQAYIALLKEYCREEGVPIDHLYGQRIIENEHRRA